MAAKDNIPVFLEDLEPEVKQQPAVTIPSPRAKRKAPSKMCTKCRSVKILTEFYGNKNWT